MPERIPSGLSESIPVSPGDPNRARAKSKRATNNDPFEPEFEVEWDQTAKTGSKRKARRAWWNALKPKFGALWKRWEACPEWKQEWFNYPHVSTWINDGRYAQDPAETRAKSPTPIRRIDPAVRAREEAEDASLERRAELLFGGGR